MGVAFVAPVVAPFGIPTKVGMPKKFHSQKSFTISRR